MNNTKNKLYTKSYAIKRLREGGFIVDNLSVIDYKKDDPRYWTILINPKTDNLLMTCFLNKDNKSDFYFKIYSHKNTITVKTKSMLVLINNLNEILSD